MTLPTLSTQEQRVLGSLLEKEITVPDTYPLTLNALRAACNQKSSREPVTDYDDRTLQDAIRSLKDKGLVRVTWMDYGKRTLKYAQAAAQVLDLADDERALLTVLLLRGPQAPGELKTRTERLHGFADRGAVEQCLTAMAAREEPLVKDLGRRPGQQDHRWVHLLGDLPVDTGPAVVVDREQALADGPAARDERLAAAFAELGDDHADERAQQLFDSPFEWWVLTRAVELAGGRPVADVGCGAGAVSAYLADLGADVTGFDRSPQQVMLARRRHPEVLFEEADLRRLLRPATAAAWGGVVAWDVLNHFAPSELPAIVRGLAGTLAPDGVLVLALDAGASEDATRDLGDQTVPWVLHDQAAVRAVLAGAGLADVDAYLRLGSVDRLYVLARRTAG
ncbi:MAG: DUF480 domain-containing protein [Tessaracoccus sp.]|uniref:DUF480 domain-containing protein n=1 Tax=Tessaracoccus sp. TaxID=1971211 RepID=UPI001EBA5B06|nr:DUF480 domain-containing protein [Tessaracoccus sp.]MBK7820093.1 DUF480 domain-containing protein [Tessaracoccus sp.]